MNVQHLLLIPGTELIASMSGGKRCGYIQDRRASVCDKKRLVQGQQGGGRSIAAEVGTRRTSCITTGFLTVLSGFLLSARTCYNSLHLLAVVVYRYVLVYSRSSNRYQVVTVMMSDRLRSTSPLRTSFFPRLIADIYLVPITCGIILNNNEASN